MESHRSTTKSKNSIELIIAFGYIIIWIAIYTLSYYQHRIFNEILWERVFADWIGITALLLLFFLNIIHKFL